MKVEIREQKQGEPWPSGNMWETPSAANLRAICPDLTAAEIGKVLAATTSHPVAIGRLTVLAGKIEEVLMERGDDVMIVKRSVVKLRDVKKGDDVPMFEGATDRERDLHMLRWLAPSLSESDAIAVLQLAGQPRTIATTIDAIKAYLGTMGPVEFSMVRDPVA